MYILLIPVIIALLIIAGIFFLVRRQWWIAAVLVVVALVVNLLSQTFALHPFATVSDVQPRTTSPRTLRLLTYNIGLHNAYLRQNTDGLQGIERFLAHVDADVVVLPESRLTLYPDFLSLLEAQYPYCITQATDLTARYVETFVFSRYPIRDVRQLGDFVYAMDVALTSDLDLRLVACHLHSNQWHSSLRGGEGLFGNLQQGYDQRLVQAEAICTALQGCQGPLVVCGDLNDLSGSPTLNTLQHGLQLSDAWWNGGLGYGATSTAKGLRFRLDHILYTAQKLSLRSVAIPDAAFSDHLPLVADFDY